MHAPYPPLIIPSSIQPFLREVTGQTHPDELPPWRGIMVYHPASNMYFASWTRDPLEYARLVRTREPARRWETVALVLRRLLERDPHYQIFLLDMRARPIVETWMTQQGKQRVITRRGEAIKGEHRIFQVYSPQYQLTRYIAAPADTPPDKIINAINRQLASWLRTEKRVDEHRRQTMRVALRSKFAPNSRVFNPETAEIRVIYPAPPEVNPRNISAYIAMCNSNAIDEFIHNTVAGLHSSPPPQFSPNRAM